MQDYERGSCSLDVKSLGKARTVEEAWKLLPSSGSGVVVLADRIVRFDPNARSGLLVEAEVYEGSSTTVLRMSGGKVWRAWRWGESEGDSHRYVERAFRSSEPGERPPELIYRQYWSRQDEDGVGVWRPIGSRFCGFREEKR